MKLKEKISLKIKKYKAKYDELYKQGFFKRMSMHLLNCFIFGYILALLLSAIVPQKQSDENTTQNNDNATITEVRRSLGNNEVSLNYLLSSDANARVVKFLYDPQSYESTLDVTIGDNPIYYVYLIHGDGSLSRINRLKPDSQGTFNPSLINTNDGLILGIGSTYNLITNYTMSSPFGQLCDNTYLPTNTNKDMANIVMNGLYDSSDLNPYTAIAPAPLWADALGLEARYGVNASPREYTIVFFDGLFLANGRLCNKVTLTWRNCSHYQPTIFGESITDYNTYTPKDNIYKDYNYFLYSMTYHYVIDSNLTNGNFAVSYNLSETVAYRNDSIIAPVGHVWSYSPLLRFRDYNKQNIIVLSYKNVDPHAQQQTMTDITGCRSYLDLLNMSPNVYGSNSTTLLGGLFGLISHAFTPIGYFMSMQLGPGFYLGYIIFAPFVVAVLVAIVKILSR